MSDILKSFDNRAMGMMSAERGHFSPEENAIRTGQLHRDLKKTGLDVTPVKGGYIENHGQSNAKEVTENSFLVQHPHTGDDHGRVHETLTNLGRKYDQDSILHKPHNSSVAHFHGTNHTGWPGMGKKAVAGSLTKRTNEPFFTRMPSGEEITFKESISNYL